MRKRAQVHDRRHSRETEPQPTEQPAPTRANDRQVAGTHYQFTHKTWDVVIDWNLGYLDGNAVKYLRRWRLKGGVQDLHKARHYIDKLIEITETSKDG